MSINREEFLKIVKKYVPNFNHFTIKYISQISHLRYARCYYALSPKNHTKSISEYNAKKICKGFKIPFTMFKHKKNKHKNLHNQQPIIHSKEPVIVFYPAGKYYSLPMKIQEIMSTKKISIQDLSKYDYLNPTMIHQLFKGKRTDIMPVDLVRLAHGLKVSVNELQKYNHEEIRIKSKPLQLNNKRKYKKNTNSNEFTQYIKQHVSQLQNSDKMLIAQLIKRLLSSKMKLER